MRAQEDHQGVSDPSCLDKSVALAVDLRACVVDQRVGSQERACCQADCHSVHCQGVAALPHSLALLQHKSSINKIVNNAESQ